MQGFIYGELEYNEMCITILKCMKERPLLS